MQQLKQNCQDQQSNEQVRICILSRFRAVFHQLSQVFHQLKYDSFITFSYKYQIKFKIVLLKQSIMGGFTSRTQQDLKFYLDRNYEISRYPRIINRESKNKATVHQVITDSTEQAHQIRSDVNLYRHINCQSISKILEYVPLQSNKVCSEQEYHYIVEEDFRNHNLKQEFLARKYYKQKFTDNQILSIIKTFLCGLNIYHAKFRRRFNGILNLDLISIDEEHNNQLRLTDPLLMKQGLTNKVNSHLNQISKDNSLQTSSASRSHLYLNEKQSQIRQAPEKLELRKTKFNEIKTELNGLLSDLYTVGIFALQLSKMQLFDKLVKPETINTGVQSIHNKQIKEIILTLTATVPDERGKIYDILKVLASDIYQLQKCFKQGRLNKVQSKNTNQTFNFKLTPHQIVTNKRQDNLSLGFLKLEDKNQGQNIHFNPYLNSYNTQLLPLQKYKFGPVSNMSTDRTYSSNSGFAGLSQGTNTKASNKTIVKFNKDSSSTISSLNIPLFNSSSQNIALNKIYHTSGTLQNHGINFNLTNKNQEQYRANSYFVNEDKKYPFRQSEYSPFKDQQKISPLSIKADIKPVSEDYKHFFNEFSNLSSERNVKSHATNDFSRPLQIATQNKRIEDEMTRLLKNSSFDKTIQTYRPYNAVTVYSPIISLEQTKQRNFASDQQFLNRNIQKNVKTQSSVYCPNSQVQEILRRLGIGSLLYGNPENLDNQQHMSTVNQNKQSNQQRKTEADISQPNRQTRIHNQQQVFVYERKYNISGNKSDNLKDAQTQNKIPQIDPEESEIKYQDIHNRQTTPIRPANKAKYNSTIVQVGDQDSQYSSSGVRNLDNNSSQRDLTYHQYVVEEYETGSKYEGYKLNGLRDGHGKFFYQDGGYYQGQWKDNKMDGWGKLFYEGGKLAYEGNWCQDEFHGFGKVYNDNPVRLECGFDFTNFDLLQDYWDFYEGMLVKDTKQGRGKIKLTNNQMFEGDFHNDRIQGFGKFFMKEGTMIEGIWRDSKLIKIISS